MEPSIVRCEAEAPDSAELRYYLRHAGALLAASDIDGPPQLAILHRARAWIAAALCGLDQVLDRVERDAVPDTEPTLPDVTRSLA